MKATAIKKLRLGMGWTQQQLADFLCLKRCQTSRIETGKLEASRATQMLLIRLMMNRERVLVQQEKWAGKPKQHTPMDIIKLREKRGLSQGEFGKLLGVSWNYVCLLENGKRRISDKLNRLLELLAS